MVGNYKAGRFVKKERADQRSYRHANHAYGSRSWGSIWLRSNSRLGVPDWEEELLELLGDSPGYTKLMILVGDRRGSDACLCGTS